MVRVYLKNMQLSHYLKLRILSRQVADVQGKRKSRDVPCGYVSSISVVGFEITQPCVGSCKQSPKSRFSLDLMYKL